MKLKLDAIILYVQNVDRLKSFYTNILGLKVIEDDKGIWTLLQAGDLCIGLHKIGDQYLDRISAGHKFDNNAKIVFKIDEDIHVIRQSLLDKNVMMREIKTFDDYNYWLCDGEDPEGNVFQLRQVKKAK